jgi:hypothetical protein
MARTANSIQNHVLLTAALEGLELQKQRIEEQIREVRSLLGKSTGRRGRPPGYTNSNSVNTSSANSGSNKVVTKSSGNGAKRAPLSASARKRIAAAQKRRWAEYRKSAGKSA